MISKRKYLYLGVATALLIAAGWLFFNSDPPSDTISFTKRVKIALRDVGNQLLLENKDSTSLVLPVIATDHDTFSLSFEEPLSMAPNSIVTIVKKSFERAELPEQYIVEVIQCEDQEVAYSYSIFNDTERDIVPCRNRTLPENCFTIMTKFIKEPTPLITKTSLLYIVSLLLIGVLILAFVDVYFIRFRESKNNSNSINNPYASIGMFTFYPEQNKLVKEAVEIGLSKKECELLAIFVAQPNQVIKRDELTKRVWEDNGVIVGRSLDTYISKLRKKLQDDTSIKITNVHGVGYKLEITK